MILQIYQQLEHRLLMEQRKEAVNYPIEINKLEQPEGNMTKIVEIEICRQCPHVDCDFQLTLFTCLLTLKNITTSWIPSWCPLPDKLEPITAEKLLEIIMKCEEYQTHSGFSKLDLKKLCELINNHFLGEKND